MDDNDGREDNPPSEDGLPLEEPIEFPIDAAAPVLAIAEQIDPDDATRGRERDREGFFERVSEYKAIEIIMANAHERALELEALALEAQREYEETLRERGGN